MAAVLLLPLSLLVASEDVVALPPPALPCSAYIPASLLLPGPGATCGAGAGAPSKGAAADPGAGASDGTRAVSCVASSPSAGSSRRVARPAGPGAGCAEGGFAGSEVGEAAGCSPAAGAPAGAAAGTGTPHGPAASTGAGSGAHRPSGGPSGGCGLPGAVMLPLRGEQAQGGEQALKVGNQHSGRGTARPAPRLSGRKTCAPSTTSCGTQPPPCSSSGASSHHINTGSSAGSELPWHAACLLPRPAPQGPHCDKHMRLQQDAPEQAGRQAHQGGM